MRYHKTLFCAWQQELSNIPTSNIHHTENLKKTALFSRQPIVFHNLKNLSVLAFTFS
jgi:hypothetical protein